MPFKKGDVNINRKGRPLKENSLTNMIEQELNRMDVGTATGNISRKEAIAKVLTNLAVQGDLSAIKAILNFMESKPGKTINLEGNLSMPIVTLTSEIENVD